MNIFTVVVPATESEVDAQNDMDAIRLIDAEGIKPTQVTGPGVTTVELLFDPVAEKWQVRVLRTYKREIAESLTENFGTDGTMACIAFEALAGRVPAGVERKSEIAACPDCQAARVWSVEDFAFACVCTDEEARLSAQGLEPESGESYGQDAEGRLILNRPVTLTHKVETYRLA